MPSASGLGNPLTTTANTVHRNGKSGLYFLGADEWTAHRAGLCEALECAGSVSIGKSAFSKLLVKTSSFVTDRASANTGQKTGLRTLVKPLHQRTFDDMQDATANCTDMKLSSLLILWCVVHQTNLVWEAVGSSVLEVSHIFHLTFIFLCYFFLQIRFAFSRAAPNCH